MDDDALIAAVFKRECLWNPAHNLHKNVIILKKMWKEVAKEINCTEKQVRGRWKNLRFYFFKELRKIGKPRTSNGADVTTSTWRCFEQLQFLKDTTAVVKRELSNSESENQSTTDETAMSFEEVQYPELSGDSQSFNTSQPQRETIHSTGYTGRVKNLLELEQQKMYLHQQDSEKGKNDDYLFFLSLLPYMTQLPSLQKLKLRSKIQDLIVEELESLQNNI